jgi:hypothetical protein
MIPLLYQLSYTAPGKFRGLRYCITPILSRKSDGFCEAVTLSETKGLATIGKNKILLLRLRMTNGDSVFV